MSVQIIIPHVGETTTTVLISRWLKGVGQRVRKGEPLLEVDTDKNTLEIEALADGVLECILVGEGMEAEAMKVVGLIRTEVVESPVEPQPHVGDRPKPLPATPIAMRVASELGVSLEHVQGSGPGGRVTHNDVRDFAARKADTPARPARVNASPKAKRLAAEHGVDIAKLVASNPDGLLRSADIPRPTGTSPEPPHETGTLPFSRRRQAIAARMSLSKSSIPHFYLQVEVDMSLCVALRAQCSDDLGWPRKPTFNDLIVRATALAMRAMPDVNVSVRGEGYVKRAAVNVGIAVGLDEGLVVPVLRDADRLGLSATHEQIRALTERARSGKLRQGDLDEKSIVVTNLGMYGMDAFFAIIDPPDPMILAVGRVRDVIVPINGQAVVRPQCVFTLSADHRILDGALAARFLARVKTLLEQPFQLMG